MAETATNDSEISDLTLMLKLDGRRVDVCLVGTLCKDQTIILYFLYLSSIS